VFCRAEAVPDDPVRNVGYYHVKAEYSALTVFRPLLIPVFVAGRDAVPCSPKFRWVVERRLPWNRHPAYPCEIPQICFADMRIHAFYYSRQP
jgi:hypothetical protein